MRHRSRMRRPNRPILVAEDLKEAKASDKLRARSVDSYATDLARRLHTATELVHVEDLPLFTLDIPFQSYVEEQMAKRAKILGAKSYVKVPQPSMESRFIDDSRVEKAVMETAAKRRPEMIVVGSHGRKGLERVYFGSVAEHIVQKSDVPVMVVGPRAQRAREKVSLPKRMKILFATDFESTSQKASKYACSLAKRLHAEIEVFHVLTERFSTALPTTYPVTNAASVEVYLEGLKKRARQKLASERAKFRKMKIPCSVALDVREVSSADALLKEIKRKKPTLVVMGTRGRNLLTDALLGGATRRVLREAPVPVITVHA